MISLYLLPLFIYWMNSSNLLLFVNDLYSNYCIFSFHIFIYIYTWFSFQFVLFFFSSLYFCFSLINFIIQCLRSIDIISEFNLHTILLSLIDYQLWFSIDILLWYVCMLVIFVLIMFHHLLIFYVCRCCYLDLYLYEQLSKIIHTAFQSLHFTMIFALYKSSIFLLFEITFFIHLLLHEYANLMF